VARRATLDVPAELLREVEGKEVASLTADLVKFPTVNPPGDEREICEFIASWFEKRGAQALLLEEVSRRTNVQVEIIGDREGGRTLILNGHTDVVPTGDGWSHDPFGGKIAGGRIYGRGSGDMKGGLAAMMVAAALLRKNRKNISGRLIFQAVADEEVGTSMGTGFLTGRGLKGDLAIVGEPTGLEVCVCHKGVIRFDIVTFGKAAHAGVPEKGVSAILAMTEIMSALRTYAVRLKRERSHSLLGPPTVNIGTIEGGVKVNIVPDRCTITAERRVVPPETVSGAVREVLAVVASAAERSGIKYKLTFNSKSQSSEAKSERGTVDVLLGAAREVTRKRKERMGFNATCDARYLNNIAHIPTVIFGPGRLENIHKPDEYVEVRELEQAARIYALCYLRLQ
jgi:succinyl-diaminopimelate desuccinylase